MKVTLLVLALNEIEGMKAIMPRLKKEWCDQIIILEGASTDGTMDSCQRVNVALFRLVFCRFFW